MSRSSEETPLHRPFGPTVLAAEAATRRVTWDSLLALVTRLTGAQAVWVASGRGDHAKLESASGLDGETQSRPLVVTDSAVYCAHARRDEQFASHPWVADAPGFRSLAIVPLYDEHNAVLGSLGVGDPELDETKLMSLLPDLARQAVAVLELQRSKIQRDILVSQIVHDLLSPIAALRLNSDYCAREVPRSLPAWEAIQDVAQISEVVDRLLRDAGDVAREGRSLRIRAEEVDVEEMLHAFHNRVFARLERSGVRLELRVEAGVGRMKLDERLLDRVLSNLLDFSLARSEPGQTVTMALRSSGGDLELRMSDTGPAVDPLRIQRLFRPELGQGSEATLASNRRFGLAFCRIAVEALRGTISARNLDSSGVMVTLRLPIQRAVEVMPLPIRNSSQPPSKPPATTRAA